MVGGSMPKPTSTPKSKPKQTGDLGLRKKSQYITNKNKAKPVTSSSIVPGTPQGNLKLAQSQMDPMKKSKSRWERTKAFGKKIVNSPGRAYAWTTGGIKAVINKPINAIQKRLIISKLTQKAAKFDKVHGASGIKNPYELSKDISDKESTHLKAEHVYKKLMAKSVPSDPIKKAEYDSKLKEATTNFNGTKKALEDARGEKTAIDTMLSKVRTLSPDPAIAKQEIDKQKADLKSGIDVQKKKLLGASMQYDMNKPEHVKLKAEEEKVKAEIASLEKLQANPEQIKTISKSLADSNKYEAKLTHARMSLKRLARKSTEDTISAIDKKGFGRVLVSDALRLAIAPEMIYRVATKISEGTGLQSLKANWRHFSTKASRFANRKPFRNQSRAELSKRLQEDRTAMKKVEGNLSDVQKNIKDATEELLDLEKEGKTDSISLRRKEKLKSRIESQTNLYSSLKMEESEIKGMVAKTEKYLKNKVERKTKKQEKTVAEFLKRGNDFDVKISSTNPAITSKIDAVKTYISSLQPDETTGLRKPIDNIEINKAKQNLADIYASIPETDKQARNIVMEQFYALNNLQKKTTKLTNTQSIAKQAATMQKELNVRKNLKSGVVYSGSQKKIYDMGLMRNTNTKREQIYSDDLQLVEDAKQKLERIQPITFEGEGSTKFNINSIISSDPTLTKLSNGENALKIAEIAEKLVNLKKGSDAMYERLKTQYDANVAKDPEYAKTHKAPVKNIVYNEKTDLIHAIKAEFLKDKLYTNPVPPVPRPNESDGSDLPLPRPNESGVNSRKITINQARTALLTSNRFKNTNPLPPPPPPRPLNSGEIALKDPLATYKPEYTNPERLKRIDKNIQTLSGKSSREITSLQKKIQEKTAELNNGTIDPLKKQQLQDEIKNLKQNIEYKEKEIEFTKKASTDPDFLRESDAIYKKLLELSSEVPESDKKIKAQDYKFENTTLQIKEYVQNKMAELSKTDPNIANILASQTLTSLKPKVNKPVNLPKEHNVVIGKSIQQISRNLLPYQAKMEEYTSKIKAAGEANNPAEFERIINEKEKFEATPEYMVLKQKAEILSNIDKNSEFKEYIAKQDAEYQKTLTYLKDDKIQSEIQQLNQLKMNNTLTPVQTTRKNELEQLILSIDQGLPSSVPSTQVDAFVEKKINEAPPLTAPPIAGKREAPKPPGEIDPSNKPIAASSESLYEDMATAFNPLNPPLPPKNTGQIAEQKKIEFNTKAKSALLNVKEKYEIAVFEKIQSLQNLKEQLKNETKTNNEREKIGKLIEFNVRQLELNKKKQEFAEEAEKNPELIQEFVRKVNEEYSTNVEQPLIKAREKLETLKGTTTLTTVQEQEKKALEQQISKLEKKPEPSNDPSEHIDQYIRDETQKYLKDRPKAGVSNTTSTVISNPVPESKYASLQRKNTAIYGAKETSPSNTYSVLGNKDIYSGVNYAEMNKIRNSTASIYSTIEEDTQSQYVDLDEVKNNTGESEYSNLTFAPERPYNVEYPVEENVYGDSDVKSNTGYLKIGVNTNNASGGGNMIHKNLKSRNLKSRKVKSKKYKIFKNSKKYKIQ